MSGGMWLGYQCQCPPPDPVTGFTFQAQIYDYTLAQYSKIYWPRKYYDAAPTCAEFRNRVLEPLSKLFEFQLRFPNQDKRVHRMMINFLLRDERGRRPTHPAAFDGARAISSQVERKIVGESSGIPFVAGKQLQMASKRGRAFNSSVTIPDTRALLSRRAAKSLHDVEETSELRKEIRKLSIAAALKLRRRAKKAIRLAQVSDKSGVCGSIGRPGSSEDHYAPSTSDNPTKYSCHTMHDAESTAQNIQEINHSAGQEIMPGSDCYAEYQYCYIFQNSLFTYLDNHAEPYTTAVFDEIEELRESARVEALMNDAKWRSENQIAETEMYAVFERRYPKNTDLLQLVRAHQHWYTERLDLHLTMMFPMIAEIINNPTILVFDHPSDYDFWELLIGTVNNQNEYLERTSQSRDGTMDVSVLISANTNIDSFEADKFDC